jgi:hypothetical protein
MSNGANVAETGLLTVVKAVTWIVYVLVSAAEIFLAFMFVLQLLGANPGQTFVAFIYRWGNLFLRPFKGIFPSAQLGAVAFINWNALVALAAYAVLAWVIGLALGSLRRRLWKDRVAEVPEGQSAAGAQPSNVTVNQDNTSPRP